MAASRALEAWPENPTILKRIQLGYEALLVAKEDPANPEAGARINDCFEQEVYEKLARRMRQHAVARGLLEQRVSLQGDEVDLEALQKMPRGTLGHALAVYYEENHIAPFHTDQPLRNDVDYVSKRYRETHDIYHLLTGYGTDVMGEMELQAFVRGNLGLRAPLMIVPFGFLTSYLGMPSAADEQEDLEPFRLIPFLRRVLAASRRGARIDPLILIRWEDHWERSIEELRQVYLDAS